MPTGEDLVQIITDDAEYNPNFDKEVDKWGFKDLGFDYKILSVLGSQSSGKSTLLNHLFNTGFAVLDATSGIHQTTLGIWASPGDTKNILVLDVEGTDSKERGEENTAFEKKTSLFSLALSEILIINVNAKDIGCLKASNFQLLKFVLELNLQLFQRKKTSKTLLLFTVRDWIEETPESVIREQLGNDMTNIWRDISKPSEFSSSLMSQFFDIDFQLFSHFRYEKSKFLDQVKTLRARLTQPDHPNYLWNPSYVTDVPADGFDIYAKNIWNVVKENRDLDLPSQKEMLALFRCGEISDQVYNAFLERIQPSINALKNNELNESFGSSLSEIVEQSMGEYNEPASRYHEETATTKGKELLNKMKKELHSVYLEYLSKLRGQVISEFDVKVEQVIPDDENEILSNFAEVMNKLRSEALTAFENKSKDAAITQAGDEWSSENDLNELTNTIDKRIKDAREGQMRRMVDKLEKDIKIKIVEPLEDVLEDPNSEMWERIRKIENEGQERTSSMLTSELSSFACTEDDINKRVSELHKRVRNTMTETIKKHVDNLYDHIMKAFTQRFQYDNGLPRKWTKDLNVEELYIESKEEVLSMIDLFSINRLDEANAELTLDDDVPIDLILLSKREATQLRKRFTQASDAMFTTARSEQERNSVATQIPAFMIILLLIFAFDEILWVLSNPFLFMLALMVGGTFALLWYFDLLYIVTPIFQTILRTSVSNVNDILTRASSSSSEKEKTE
mmetsp:Transcript_1196/g.1909  ORF Transcript_1196/g.1909 Transcript_1196/m.1909 type:complete len:737 (-) Transcript_1196:90-2300(-)